MNRCLSVLLVLAFVLPLAAQEELRFAASDGHPLVADHYAPAEDVVGGVVLLHMYQSGRNAWRRFAATLAHRGFHVIAPDMRGHGDSKANAKGEPLEATREAIARGEPNPFLEMHRDATACLDQLEKLGVPKDRLYLVGASVGCSVALHTASLLPDRVAGVILLTPGTDYLDVPSLEHAKGWKGQPLLILSSEEEAAHGAKPIAKALEGARTTLRLLPQQGIHGTRMFGRVPAIEADLIDWLLKASHRTMVLDLPLTRGVIADGALEFGEALGAPEIRLPVGEGGDEILLRLSRSSKALVIGMKAPERCLRRNGLEFWLDGLGTVRPAVDEACWHGVFLPRDSTRGPMILERGDAGRWVPEEDHTGFEAFAKTREKESWTAEIALDLDRFLGDGGGHTFRLALAVRGQKEGAVTTWPASGADGFNPGRWIEVRIKSPK